MAAVDKKTVKATKAKSKESGRNTKIANPKEINMIPVANIINCTKQFMHENES